MVFTHLYHQAHSFVVVPGYRQRGTADLADDRRLIDRLLWRQVDDACLARRFCPEPLTLTARGLKAIRSGVLGWSGPGS